MTRGSRCPSTILPGHKKNGRQVLPAVSLHEGGLLTAPLGVCHACTSRPRPIVWCPEMKFRGVVARAFVCAAESAAVPSTQDITACSAPDLDARGTGLSLPIKTPPATKT